MVGVVAVVEGEEEEEEENGSDWLGVLYPGEHWEICGQGPS